MKLTNLKALVLAFIFSTFIFSGTFSGSAFAADGVSPDSENKSQDSSLPGVLTTVAQVGVGAAGGVMLKGGVVHRIVTRTEYIVPRRLPTNLSVFKSGTFRDELASNVNLSPDEVRTLSLSGTLEPRAIVINGFQDNVHYRVRTDGVLGVALIATDVAFAALRLMDARTLHGIEQDSRLEKNLRAQKTADISPSDSTLAGR